MTRDIDLVVTLRVADSARIRSLFEPVYCVPDNLERAIASIDIFNLVHVESAIKVDIISAQERGLSSRGIRAPYDG